SAFHRTTARQLKREPKRRELIEERNRLVLSQFDKTDIEEVWPAETAEPRMFHFDKAAAAEARIGLEIPGNAGIGLATCYRKRGTACLSGYLKGLDSACANRCNIADTLERAVKANAAFNLKSDVFVEGRLIDERAAERPALAGFEVKLFLPGGGTITTNTDSKGYFLIKVETA